MNQSTHAHRGDRLHPPRWHRLYWHLTCLRRVIEKAARDHLREQQYSRLVDYGCGNMPYRSLLEPLVESYEGADLAGNDLATIQIDENGQLPVASSSVNLLFSSQVLEHVGDPGLYLRESHRVLDPNGLLLLSTHGTWRYHPDPEDYWRWTSAGLRRVLESNGFQIIAFHAVMSPPVTAMQLFQDFTMNILPSPLRPLYCLPYQFAMQIVDSIVPEKFRLKDASVYVVVAKPV